MEYGIVVNLHKASLILFALTTVVLAQAKAHACSLAYTPSSTVEARRSAGLFDGNIGKVAFKNTENNVVKITLYDPNASEKVFGTYTIQPGSYVYIGEDSHSSDWGIQMNDRLICVLGRVSTWETSSSQPYFLVNVELLSQRNEFSISIDRIEAFKKGNESYRNKDYQKAIEYYDLGDWKNDDYWKSVAGYLIPEMFYNRGNAYYKIGNYAEALKNYQQAIHANYEPNHEGDLPELNRQFPEAYYNMVMAALALGDEDLAASAYSGLLDLYDPPPPKWVDYLKNSRSLEESDTSKLEGDIFPILSEHRWLGGAFSGTGTPLFTKTAFREARVTCPQAIKAGGKLKIIF
jgi:tetratricopeptide (TPR) repeat protein